MLVHNLKEADTLDQVVGAHDEYLRFILNKGMIPEATSSMSRSPLNLVLGYVLRFCSILTTLSHQAILVLEEHRQQLEAAGLAPERAGLRRPRKQHTEVEEAVWGSLTQLESEYQQQIAECREEYEECVGEFLDHLQRIGSKMEEFRFLAVRLNFNEYYTVASAMAGARSRGPGKVRSRLMSPSGGGGAVPRRMGGVTWGDQSQQDEEM
ncbi:unnamed protein product [Symbiodinium sp. KB8]|nr:unnamed protein product [Symbiodinium sp. KB8]